MPLEAWLISFMSGKCIETALNIGMEHGITDLCNMDVNKISRYTNGCRIYVEDKNCRQFSLQFAPAFIGRAVYQLGGEIVILTQFRVHFIIEHENLV